MQIHVISSLYHLFDNLLWKEFDKQYRVRKVQSYAAKAIPKALSMRTMKKIRAIIVFLLMYLRFKIRQCLRKSFKTHIIQTQYGPIKGARRISCWNEPFYSYEKIPFAKPPVGNLRFKDPVPPNSWKKPLNCTKEAPMPRQVNVVMKNVEGNEDCLYLNVFTNDPDSRKPRPVMVWIYGGGFVSGTTSKNFYSPDYFMSENVVLVSIAYRVSILGFLSLKDPSLGIPGNAGLKDQIMALKWVRDNIANFGGDPNNVTVFGESAGGASVHYLMLSDQAKGLFHRAIMMSGSALTPWALVPPNNWVYRLAQRMGFKGELTDRHVLDFFMKAKSGDLVKHDSKLLNKEEIRNLILFASGPVIEPYVNENCVIPKHPRLMARDAWGKDVPVIIGGNSFEGLFCFPDVKKHPWKLETFKNGEYLVPLELNLDRDSAKCKELGLRLLKEHFANQKPTLFPYLNLLSYKYFWHGLHRTLLSRAKYAKAPTFLYRFDFDSPTFNHARIICCGKRRRGVSHADDLSYLFYNAIAHDLRPGSAEYKTIKSLVGMWTQFAETGDPNIESVTTNAWQPIRNDETFKCLNISYKISFIDLPESKSLEVWDSLYEEDDLI